MPSTSERSSANRRPKSGSSDFTEDKVLSDAGISASTQKDWTIPKAVPTEAEEAPANERLALYYTSGNRYSSRAPNQELLWDLLDRSPANQDANADAAAIIQSWPLRPWKGMVWYAQPPSKFENTYNTPASNKLDSPDDLYVDGNNWKPIAERPKVEDRPLGTPRESKASIDNQARYRLLMMDLESYEVSTQELNSAYEAYAADAERWDDLMLTIAAFMRSKNRVRQCQKLLNGKPETSLEMEDIFTSFNEKITKDLRPKTDGGPATYEHKGTLERWLGKVWSNFIKDVKTDFFNYINSTRFINNSGELDEDNAGGKPEFKWQPHSVSTFALSTEDCTTDSARSAIEIVLRDLDDPTSNLYGLTAATKAMIRSGDLALGTAEIASKEGISQRQARRRLDKALEDCRERLAAREVTTEPPVHSVQSSLLSAVASQ